MSMMVNVIGSLVFGGLAAYSYVVVRTNRKSNDPRARGIINVGKVTMFVSGLCFLVFFGNVVVAIL